MRKLAGALLNHLHLMKTPGTYISGVLTLGAAAAYLFTENDTFRMVAILAFLLLLPLCSLGATGTSFGSKWSQFERLWDLPQLTIILARYIVFAAICAALAALWIISPLHDGDMYNIADILSIMLLIGALYYPVMYMINAKHDAGMLVLVCAFSLSFIAVQGIAVLLNDRGLWRQNGMNFILLGVVCGFYVLSFALSAAFNAIHLKRGA